MAVCTLIFLGKLNLSYVPQALRTFDKPDD